MSLKIEDPEAESLAYAIVNVTGETLNRVVTEALRERLGRLQRGDDKASVEELLAIARRFSTQVTPPYVDHAELLYDERGLPG